MAALLMPPTPVYDTLYPGLSKTGVQSVINAARAEGADRPGPRASPPARRRPAQLPASRARRASRAPSVSPARLDATGGGGRARKALLPWQHRALRKRAGGDARAPRPRLRRGWRFARTSRCYGRRGAGGRAVALPRRRCDCRERAGGDARAPKPRLRQGCRVRGRLDATGAGEGATTVLPRQHRALRKHAGETPAHPGSPRLRRDAARFLSARASRPHVSSLRAAAAFPRAGVATAANVRAGCPRSRAPPSAGLPPGAGEKIRGGGCGARQRGVSLRPAPTRPNGRPIGTRRWTRWSRRIGGSRRKAVRDGAKSEFDRRRARRLLPGRFGNPRRGVSRIGCARGVR